MKIAETFSAARWRVCWATTFTFEPAFFEAFLLRRLGDPPFNAVVLGDAQRLAETWGGLGPHDTWRVPGLNRRYLVRGVSAGGAFHAKTILLGNEKRGVLLVGSGNLGLSGLERGDEVFARIESADEASAFTAWRIWMSDLVARLDDPMIRGRWADLLGRLPWLTQAVSGHSSFITNTGGTLVERFLMGLPEEVDELRVTAPFFDHELAALDQLVAATRPRRLVIYLGDGASVNGRKLAAFIQRGGQDSTVLGYRSPDGDPRYVHAKLIAAITGDRARLLVGSANLSRPALLEPAWTGAGNIEAGVVRDLGVDETLALFEPSGRLSIVALDAAAVESFELAEMAAVASFPVRLLSASRPLDGRIEVDVVGAIPPGAHLTDGEAQVVLDARRAAEPLGRGDAAQLVWIVDIDGQTLSNRVPVADEQALDAALAAARGDSDARPRELDPLDIGHPLGQILFDLHRNAVFDIDDTPASRRLGTAKSTEITDADADAFWDRYFREELGRDPRAGRYGGFGVRGHTDGLFLDEFAALLLQMLERAPRPGELRLLDGTIVTREEAEKAGIAWTDARRIRLRAYNVLMRWASAVNDPRVRWFGDQAPARHYVALLGALARIWPQIRAERDEDRWLTPEQAERILRTLLGAFIRTDRSAGVLAGLPDDERLELQALLAAQGAPSMAAALAHDVLRSARPATYFDWQPYLVAALDWGIVVPDEGSVRYLQDAVGTTTTVDQISLVLRRAADYIDDDHWCAAQARDLGFLDIRINRKSGNSNFPTDVLIDAGTALLADPRIPGLIRLALDYVRTPFRLRAGTQLTAVALGKLIAADVGRGPLDAIEPLTLHILDELERDGAGLGRIFLGDEADAAAYA